MPNNLIVVEWDIWQGIEDKEFLGISTLVMTKIRGHRPQVYVETVAKVKMRTI